MALLRHRIRAATLFISVILLCNSNHAMGQGCLQAPVSGGSVTLGGCETSTGTTQPAVPISGGQSATAPLLITTESNGRTLTGITDSSGSFFPVQSSITSSGLPPGIVPSSTITTSNAQSTIIGPPVIIVSDGTTTTTTPVSIVPIPTAGSSTLPSLQPTDTQQSNTQPPGTQPSGTEPPGTQPPGTQPTSTQPPGTQPPGTQPPGTQPPGTQPPGTQPPGTQPPGTQPAGTQPPDTQPPGTQPPGTQPTETQSEPSCTRPTAVPQCTVTVSTFQTGTMTTVSSRTMTTCLTITTCNLRGTTTTSSTATSEATPWDPGFRDPFDWDRDENWPSDQARFIASMIHSHGPLLTESATQTHSTINGPATPSPHVSPGQPIAPGTELRILPLGDSITYGWPPTFADGNSYRLQLLNDLHADHVVFAGNESHGSMQDNWMAAWPGQTIQHIQNAMGPSLAMNPNIILLHAGTNDLLPAGDAPGVDPGPTADKLGQLLDQITNALPNTVILVAQIIPCADNPAHTQRTQAYDGLIPNVVQSRADAGALVLYVDFSALTTNLLQGDGVHPDEEGYRLMGDIWYNALRGIPDGWIQPPDGPDPMRPPHSSGVDVNANGGPDPVVATPSYGIDYVQGTNPAQVQAQASTAGEGGRVVCNSPPSFIGNTGTPKIAQGVGHSGDWHFNQNWISYGNTPFASGIHLPGANVKLADMDGDGKADYLWVNPDTGELTCWLNGYPGPYHPGGTNGPPRVGVIADGAGRGDQVFFADMNGNGKADYLVVDPDDGSVRVYWNEGPDPGAENGWRFNPGGVIATGVSHANLETLRFADINGDGRADYVVAGVDGSLVSYYNEGQPGSYNIIFINQSGIATGAEQDLTRLTLDDVDGDGRADYLIWDDQGGITGFLNIKTRSEGVPFFANQGPPKAIAQGIGQDPSVIQLADLDGDGKKDYCYIDTNGALWLWWNRGSADTSVAADGVQFADMDGDGIDDYVWIDQVTGSPTLYINEGPSTGDPLGWSWVPANPAVIASGAGPRPLIHLADITGDGKADYIVVNASNGAADLYINGGADPAAANNWRFTPIGTIASGLGEGAHVRFADIDGDGRADYIFLKPNGGTAIYRNQYRPNSLQTEFVALPAADAAGINQRPEDITFRDMNGDGKADYIYTHALDGETYVYLNNYPNTPTWLPPDGPSQQPLGESGQMIRYADLQGTGRASQIILDPDTAAMMAFLNGCSDRAGPPCQEPKTTSGPAQFYYWETSSNDVDTTNIAGISAKVDWNQDALLRAGIEASPSNDIHGPSGYNNGQGTSFTINGTFTVGGAECGQNGLIHFMKACDGSYNVVGTGGEIANCVRDGLPRDVNSNGPTSSALKFRAQLVCTGSLCLAEWCTSPLIPGCSSL